MDIWDDAFKGRASGQLLTFQLKCFINQPLMLSLNQFIAILAALFAGLAVSPAAFAGQGAQRMAYTVPNNTFIQHPAGDSVVTISDTSGSVTTLQAAISGARTANPGSIISIRLLSGATYWVDNNSGGLVLGSQECLIGTGAVIAATNAAVTNSLITISPGSTNAAVAGGTLNAGGANIYGIYAPAAARVNIDKVTVKNCGQDCIQLNGHGSGAFDNEMTVTRCDVSGSPSHAGISIQNATQATCVDNNCHNNLAGIWLAGSSYCNLANNTCESNMVGIDYNSGNNNYIINNTCNNNATGILADGDGAMVVSDLLASNTVAGLNSSGSGNIYCDDLFGGGNATNFIDGGSGDDIVAYQGSLNGSGQNYFYPPLVDNQHTAAIVNGQGRYDLTDSSTGPIDTVQSEYNAAVSANPGSVIVLHLNGSYTVGANPLTLSSDTCILLGGKIQINSATTTSEAIYANGASYLSISGGTIDGGTTSSSHAGHDAIYFTGCSMFQIDAVTMQNFGTSGTRVGGSDVVRIDHGSTPRIFTRNTIANGSARGFWLATSGPRDMVSDNTVTGVQMDGVDCDESTSASVIKNNYLANNTRYGVFLEQSASDNLVFGNVCNYDASYAIGCYNNSVTPRGATAYNSVICNSLLGDNGLRNGSTGDSNNVTSSDNFFFNNTVMSANIESQLYGSQNYYSQNYLGNSSLSTSGTEAFFNSPDVSGNLYIEDSHSGLAAVVTNASTAVGAAVILGPTNSFGSDHWSLLPTDGGYYKIINKNSGLALVVSNASLNAGASIIQWTYNASGNDEWMPKSAGNGLYNFVNRLSGLDLEVAGAGTAPGTPWDQQPASGAANQQFDLLDAPAAPTFSTITNLVATDYWLGNVSLGNWSNGANWLSGNAPMPFDSLAFTNQSGAADTANNDFPAGTAFAGLTFANSTIGSTFDLTGNRLLLSGATNGITLGITNATALAETIGNNLALDWGYHTFNNGAGGSLALPGTLTPNLGAVAYFPASGVASSSFTTDGNGLISGLDGSGLIGTNALALLPLATVSGGNVVPLPIGNYISVASGAISGNATANLELSATTTAACTANNLSVNTITADKNAGNTGGSQAITLTTTGTLTLGNQGGIYVTGSGPGDKQILDLTGGNLTAGTASGGGTLVFGINGTTTGNQMEMNSVIQNNGAGGPVTVVKAGPGSMYFNTANTYSGGTYVDQGYLQINNSTGLGPGPAYVAGGAEIYLQASSGNYANSFYLSPGMGVSYSPLGAIKIGNGSSLCTIAGTLNLLGTPVTNAPGDMLGGSGSSGAVQLTGQITGGGTLEADAIVGSGNYINFYFDNNTANTNNWTGGLLINPNGTGSIYVKDAANNQLNGNNVTIYASGSGTSRFDLNGSHNEMIGALNSGSPGSGSLQVDNAEAGTSTLTLGANDASGAFSGTIRQDGGMLNLIKIGAGTQTFTGANTYTGATTINGGTLALSGSGSLANSSPITIASGATLDVSGYLNQTFTVNNGQVLQGGGTVNVDLTIGTGAIIMPGDAADLGTLSIAGALQLQGTAIFKLKAATGNGDQLIAGSFNYGGTLTVTNLFGTFAAGQGFQLFAGGSYTGGFNAINLPSLGAGLAWSNSLSINGTLQVISTVPAQPQFTNTILSGANLILGGTGGTPGQPCYLLISTNLTLPRQNWQVIATNIFDANGDVTFTNSINPNAPPSFYLLWVQ
jgi:autotransporter-associated beta strand protein/parallel beta-helix repeat protein